MSASGLQATLEEDGRFGCIRQHGPDMRVLPYRVTFAFGEEGTDLEDVIIGVEGPHGRVDSVAEGNVYEMKALWNCNARDMLQLCTRFNLAAAATRDDSNIVRLAS